MSAMALNPLAGGAGAPFGPAKTTAPNAGFAARLPLFDAAFNANDKAEREQLGDLGKTAIAQGLLQYGSGTRCEVALSSHPPHHRHFRHQFPIQMPSRMAKDRQDDGQPDKEQG